MTEEKIDYERAKFLLEHHGSWFGRDITTEENEEYFIIKFYKPLTPKSKEPI